jgi:hypothetical protein
VGVKEKLSRPNICFIDAGAGFSASSQTTKCGQTIEDVSCSELVSGVTIIDRQYRRV